MKIKCYFAVCCGCNQVNNVWKNCQSHNGIMEIDNRLHANVPERRTGGADPEGPQKACAGPQQAKNYLRDL